MGHDFGLVMATITRPGDVMGRPVQSVKFVTICRACGMRPDGKGQVYGVGILRRTSCTDGVHPRHDKV